MMLRKITDTGPQTLLQAGTLTHTASDEYSLAIDCCGINQKGDVTVWRLVLSRNEISQIKEWSEKA